MRNVVVPLVILVLVAAFIAVNLAVVTDGVSRLDRLLETAETAVLSGDFEAARSAISDFSKDFAVFRKYLDAVISHTETDNIMLSAERLPAMCREETAADFLSEAAVTRALLRHIRDCEMPTLENIL